MHVLKFLARVVVAVVVLIFVFYIIFLFFGWGFFGGDEDAGRSNFATVLYYVISIGIAGVAAYAVAFSGYKNSTGFKSESTLSEWFLTSQRKHAFAVSIGGGLLFFVVALILFSGRISVFSTLFLIFTPVYPFVLYAGVMGFYKIFLQNKK